MTPVDSDALNVMKDIGQEFAEKQYFRHWNNEWELSPESQEERKAHWKAVKDRIGEIVSLIKQEMKEKNERSVEY